MMQITIDSRPEDWLHRCRPGDTLWYHKPTKEIYVGLNTLAGLGLDLVQRATIWDSYREDWVHFRSDSAPEYALKFDRLYDVLPGLAVALDSLKHQIHESLKEFI